MQSPDRFAVTDSNTVVYSISSGRIADVILGKFSVSTFVNQYKQRSHLIDASAILVAVDLRVEKDQRYRHHLRKKYENIFRFSSFAEILFLGLKSQTNASTEPA